MDDQQIFKVTEFNEFIDILVSQRDVIVEGEITEISVSQGRWIFITIKEQSSSLEIFSVVNQINTLNLLREGMLVHVYGTPHLHKKSGRFRLHASQILPAGEGELRIAFEKLKIMLEKEGLFAPERKRLIPQFPEKIGLLTARNSAAYSDFVKVLNKRSGGIKIYFLPVSVQGVNAISEITMGIKSLNSKYPNLDLIILTRGGGSLEDLQAFNSEDVVRAIFVSKIPIVSAVGHEKDWTISDMVADFRASTPSNAAELLVREKSELEREISNYIFRMETLLLTNLNNKKAFVKNCLNRIEYKLLIQTKNVKELIFNIRQKFISFEDELGIQKEKIIELTQKSIESEYRLLNENKSCYNRLVSLLRVLDHQNILNRGYSITFQDNGHILKSEKLVKSGQIIKTKLSVGNIISKVE